MSTIRNLVIVAQLGLYNTGRPLGVPAGIREMLDDIPAGVDRATSFGEAKEMVERVGGARGPIVIRSFVTAIDHWARGNSTTSAGEMLDEQLAWTTKSLGGSNLGGLIDTEHELETHWDRERRTSRCAHATVYVLSKFTTRVDDATVRS